MRKNTTVARGALALAVAIIMGLLAHGSGASAQIVPGTTTTTSPPVSPTTTTPGNTTATTTPKFVGGDDAAGAKGTIPPGYAKIIASVKRSKANNTKLLLTALQPLVDNGMSQTDVAILGFGRFPVAGAANFTDDWLNPRFTPIFHLHEGTDIFAPMGTPVRSPVDGVVRHSGGDVGGLAAYVRTAEGHEVYMAHLSGFSDVQVGQTVKVGDVVGYCGNTGDAAGGAPHVHFEIHPKGKGPVNPKPYLDQWLAQALTAAPSIVAARITALPVAPLETAPQELSTTVEKVLPPRVQLAWASSSNPTGGALRLAEVEATAASLKVDWAHRARVAQAQRRLSANADARAKAMLRPLTPPGLLDVLGLR